MRLISAFLGTKASEEWYRRASLLLLVVSILLMLSLFDDYGVSWDEPTQMRWGDGLWEFYVEVFRGERALNDGSGLKNSLVHPSFFDLLNAAARRTFGLGDYQTGHLLSIFFGWLGLLASYLTARRLGDEQSAFWALLLLLATPRYFGHLWFNPKDIPFAACFAWALYALILCLQGFPRPKWRDLALLGFTTGLALGVRIAALLILLYYGLAATAWVLQRSCQEPKQWRQHAWDWGRLALKGGGVALLMVVIVLPFWPGIWLKSESRGGSSAADAVKLAQSFDWDYPVRFAGDTMSALELPRSYLPQWLWITLPEFFWLILAAGSVVVAWQGRHYLRKPAKWSGPWLPVAVLALAVVFPLAYVVATRPVLYDGMRHFLFILPPLAVLTALALGTLANILQRSRFPWAASALLALTAVLVGGIAVRYVQLHPYQYIYFNQFAGGLRTAGHDYETDYWGLSMREASETLAEIMDYAYAGADAHPSTVVYVPTSIPEWLAVPYFPRHWEFTRDPDRAHFAMAFTRFGLHKGFANAPLITMVEREDVPLAYVRVLRPPPGFAAGLAIAAQQPLPEDAPDILKQMRASLP